MVKYGGRNARRVVFSLIPVLLLLLGAEAAFRLGGLAGPKLNTLPLPEELAGILRHDQDLFWSLRPGVSIPDPRAPLRINRHGTRGPDLQEKEDNEYRILSLGESSTFGVAVGDEETYTALLAVELGKRDSSRTFTAINAGTSAWSSFQSLKFLELRGLDLKPDLVVFYHELNDYLPSTLRDSSRNELGVLKTDRELYESHAEGLHRFMMRISALYQYLSYRAAFRKIQAFGQDDFVNPAQDIGLPDISIPGRLTTVENPDERAGINEQALGRRVSENEREQNLTELIDLCRRHDVALVVVHPSYRSSKSHRCLLTDFCKKNSVLMFDAHDTLHPVNTPHGFLYHDSWHPNREGHKRLAAALADFIDTRLVANAP